MIQDGIHGGQQNKQCAKAQTALFVVCQLNVQSINNKTNTLEVFLHENKPDILSIAEHWCPEEQMKIIQLEGYKMITAFCREKWKNGGSCIYAKSEIVDEAKPLNITRFAVEKQSEWCAVIIKKAYLKCCVVSVYRPPDGDRDVFLRLLSDTLVYCFGICENVFLCGDLNINYKLNSIGKRLLEDLFLGFGLEVVSSEPTRIKMDSSGMVTGTQIDYLITNLSSDMYEVSTIQPNIADHLAIVLAARAISAHYKCSLPGGRFS